MQPKQHRMLNQPQQEQEQHQVQHQYQHQHQHQHQHQVEESQPTVRRRTQGRLRRPRRRRKVGAGPRHHRVAKTWMTKGRSLRSRLLRSPCTYAVCALLLLLRHATPLLHASLRACVRACVSHTPLVFPSRTCNEAHCRCCVDWWWLEPLVFLFVGVMVNNTAYCRRRCRDFLLA